MSNSNVPSTVVVDEVDYRAWQRVERVEKAWRDGAQNTSHACEMAEVRRDQYYRDIKRPYVQERRLERIRGVQHAVQEVIEQEWIPVVVNQIAIAKGRSRDAVAAARFVREVYAETRALLDESTEAQAEEATTFLQQFASGKGKRTFTARKRGKSVDLEAKLEIPAESPS